MFILKCLLQTHVDAKFYPPLDVLQLHGGLESVAVELSPFRLPLLRCLLPVFVLALL